MRHQTPITIPVHMNVTRMFGYRFIKATTSGAIIDSVGRKRVAVAEDAPAKNMMSELSAPTSGINMRAPGVVPSGPRR